MSMPHGRPCGTACSQTGGSGAAIDRYDQFPPPKRKFTPPRTTSLLSETLLLGATPQLKPQFMLPRSTWRYSALAVQLLVSASSTPPPAVHPALVWVAPAKPGVLALMSPTATPPVTKGRNLS